MESGCFRNSRDIKRFHASCYERSKKKRISSSRAQSHVFFKYKIHMIKKYYNLFIENQDDSEKNNMLYHKAMILPCSAQDKSRWVYPKALFCRFCRRPK
ncbi:MAG: hypothetical protein A2096_06430 [Spirochaetes bacterium GWF1_41_5]|nr:MAG: hypothetical protein A2096_06430 [Spirochaetes bacterium GWF1_41_5]HBE03734.1 hypothetical protein [Spirochaetia bacterium]